MSRSQSLLVWILFFLTFSLGVCAADAPLEVLYAQLNSTILTYNIDPQTLQGTLVGQPLKAKGSAVYLRVVPAPDDHFLYVLSGTQQSPAQTLSVYATDESGVPQAPAVQVLGPGLISSFIIDPNGRFAYMFTYVMNADGTSTYKLRLFSIDRESGKLVESQRVQATYTEDSYCFPAFNSFDADGDQLVDVLGCGYPDINSITYYFRTVDSRTGQLGPDVQFFQINDAVGSSGDEVTVGRRTFVDLHQQLNPFQESVQVYARKVNPGNPIINCTTAMLQACGETGGYVPDITGRYLAMSLSSTFDIVRIDLKNKQLVDTGNSFPSTFQPYFSPDDSIMYAVNYQFPNGNSTIQIYGFDPNTGGLTMGGQISIPPILWNVIPARRR